ncbi:MAG: type II toxin-antitoxin system prevent-host-death family antitoxin [Thermoanaerobaculia bacterium]|nr:type II toxin-antitoxin system prevent-host-death family antitoxin [Thermoanaerobaculia bacterium]
MPTIPQRELRNHSGEILRRAEVGQQFTITVDGRPVAVLGPQPKPKWVARDAVFAALRSLPSDPTFFEDIADMAGSHEDLEDPWRS